jgi:signal transduction histidine kinase
LYNVPERFSLVLLFISITGIGSGIVVSRILSAPITKLADAAHQIGKGELSTRVAIDGSQELVELAQAFNTMAAGLQKAETLRRNLMADVSHELRTPLAVLEGNLRAALDHVYELDEEAIAHLYVQTHHLIRLVNDLRELSLAEAHQLPLDKQPTDLGQLVAETLAVFEPLAEEKQIKLTAQILPSLPAIEVDASRLRQVLHNLVANALRHTPAGGRIALTGQLTNNQLVLTVQDTGEGMDPQHIEHVFDRFYRTDPSRSRETGGSGLGLAIVKAIVEAHGGLVNASSAGLGQGSTFMLHLPV